MSKLYTSKYILNNGTRYIMPNGKFVYALTFIKHWIPEYTDNYQEYSLGLKQILIRLLCYRLKR